MAWIVVITTDAILTEIIFAGLAVTMRSDACAVLTSGF
jgi:hypothetical protein